VEAKGVTGYDTKRNNEKEKQNWEKVNTEEWNDQLMPPAEKGYRLS